MKYWTIIGLGYVDLEKTALRVSQGRNPRGWEHFTYIIKAENIEAAYLLFDKHVGHNYFPGFAEFAKECDAAQMNIMYIAEEGEAIWRATTARASPRTRLN